MPHMKVFIFRFNTEFLVEVARRLMERNVDILYWGGSKRFFEEAARNKALFPNTIFHDTLDAIRGLPADALDEKQFPPIGNSLVAQMLRCESETLTMMASVDLEGTISLSQKKHLYYQYLRYWYGVLTTLRPDAVIFGDIPHIAHQHVVYSLAKLLGIKVVMYRTIQITGRVLFETLLLSSAISSSFS